MVLTSLGLGAFAQTDSVKTDSVKMRSTLSELSEVNSSKKYIPIFQYWKEHDIFQHLDVSVTLGTTGIGIDVASPVTEWAQLRLGYEFMPRFTKRMSFEMTINGQILYCHRIVQGFHSRQRHTDCRTWRKCGRLHRQSPERRRGIRGHRVNHHQSFPQRRKDHSDHKAQWNTCPRQPVLPALWRAKQRARLLCRFRNQQGRIHRRIPVESYLSA